MGDMTSDALVRMVLTGESCELYDRIRIKTLFKNVLLGYGAIAIHKDYISITYSGGKSKKVVYKILNELLTNEQKEIIKNL